MKLISFTFLFLHLGEEQMMRVMSILKQTPFLPAFTVRLGEDAPNLCDGQVVAATFFAGKLWS
jgi:hypothetical protein